MEAGLNITRFAELMGVTRMSVYNWEHGVHPMKARDYEYFLFVLAVKEGRS